MDMTTRLDSTVGGTGLSKSEIAGMVVALLVSSFWVVFSTTKIPVGPALVAGAGFFVFRDAGPRMTIAALIGGVTGMTGTGLFLRLVPSEYGFAMSFSAAVFSSFG